MKFGCSLCISLARNIHNIKPFFFLYFLLAYSLAANAQDSKKMVVINGQVVEAFEKTPIRYASISLKKFADSSLLKTSFTDSIGNFSITVPYIPKCYLVLQALGYKLHEQLINTSEITMNDTISIGTILLEREYRISDTVSVNVTKPYIEKKIDRIAINVDKAVINAGTNILEVIKRSPGVQVDNSGAISVAGKQGTIVTINDRRLYLSGTDLLKYLHTLQTDRVEQIEIITLPSSKYSAEGNAGIINIKLKKTTKVGHSFSTNISYNQGKYPKYDASMNYGYSNKNFRFMATWAPSKIKNFESNFFDKQIAYDNTRMEQAIYTPTSKVGNTYSANADISLDKKNLLSIGLTGSKYTNEGNSQNTTTFDNNDGIIDSASITNNNLRENLIFTGANINYIFNIDSSGNNKLFIDADYAYFKNKQDQIFKMTDLGHNNILVSSPSSIRTLVPREIDVKSFQVNYKFPLYAFSVELGLKGSQMKMNTEINYFVLSNSADWQSDKSKDNIFDYKENITAVFADVNSSFRKFNLRAGLRFEYTKGIGNSQLYPEMINIKYGNLFPNIALIYNPSDNNSWIYSYSYRIDRPQYNYLNPFVYYIDKYTTSEGNPSMMPQFTHSVGIDYIYRKKYKITAGYSRSTGFMSQTFVQNDSSKQSKIILVNLSLFSNYNFSFSFPLKVTKWWSMDNSGTIFYRAFKSELNQEKLCKSGATISFTNSQTFEFSKTFTGELSCFYSSPKVSNIFQFGAYPFITSIGIRKTFWNDKGSLSLNVTDLFQTNKDHISVKYQNLNFKINQAYDSRTIGLTFKYLLNSQIKKAIERASNAEEVNRAK